MDNRPLRAIPGVGKKTEQDLLALGFTCVGDLKDQDPREIYERDCTRRGFVIDICQLYVYRCAVYFARTPQPEPEKCKWWYWKDHVL
nr:helix-hairpin-helix domain-containing protein [Maliibacterium massiliense]